MHGGPLPLSELYPKATNIRKEVDQLLESLESGSDVSVSTQQRLGALTNEFSRLIDKLEEQWSAEGKLMSNQQQQTWKRRIHTLKDDARSFRSSLDKQLGQLYKTAIDERERQLLFGGYEKKGDSSQMYIRERDILHESHNAIDSVTSQGAAIVENLYQQNRSLKTAQKKVLDMSNSLGLSSSLLGVIGRRHAMDKWLVFSCMAFTLLLFYATWRFVHA